MHLSGVIVHDRCFWLGCHFLLSLSRGRRRRSDELLELVLPVLFNFANRLAHVLGQWMEMELAEEWIRVNDMVGQDAMQSRH